MNDEINKTLANAGVLSLKMNYMGQRKELTYILGAGASFQSIPIVKTFGERFKFFITSQIGFLRDRSSSIEKVGFEQVFNEGILLSTEFNSHQSFDTFFKKLFHTNEKNRILLAKKLLNLYFIWEHCITSLSPPTSDKNAFIKQSLIDKRYDALIAGILKPINGSNEVFCKTNFITWNYDFNLLASIKNYFYPDYTFQDFINVIKTDDENVFNVNNQISIINMNGYHYSKFYDEIKKLNEFDSKQVFRSKVNNNYLLNGTIDKDSELIKFAWEGDQTVGDIASEKINSSYSVIVIGYTFPLYNRLIDLKYFNQRTVSNCFLYIQDPDSDVLLQNIKDGFNIDLSNYHLKTIKNCDSFFVPSNIYKM